MVELAVNAGVSEVFKKKCRGSSYALIEEVTRNKHGDFFKSMRISRGIVKNIIVETCLSRRTKVDRVCGQLNRDNIKRDMRA